MKKKLLIINHSWVRGAGQELLDFLRKKKHHIIYIEHSLTEFSSSKHTMVQKFINNKLVYKKKYFYFFKKNTLIFFEQFLLNCFLMFKYSKKIDLAISTNCFNTFCVAFFKKILKINKNIYYCIDYMPKRFDNLFLNFIYKYFDYFSTLKSDFCWNLNYRMTKKKVKEYKINKKNKFVTVPIGVPRLKIKNNKLINKKIILVFFGTIKKDNGLELIFNAHAKYFQNNNLFETWIIGKGSYFNELKKNIKKNEIKNLRVFGEINNSKKIDELFISYKFIGLAPYKFNYQAYYADVTKPKFYINYGIPVVITKFVSISKDIEKNKLGKVINYNLKSYLLAIRKIAKEIKYDRKIMQKRIHNFAQNNYLWDKIFISTFNKIKYEI